MAHTGTSIFNNLFGDAPIAVVEKQGKGRNEDLHAARNEFLLDRYFFYGFYTDKRPTVILELVSSQVYLSERRVYDIICENTDYLQRLRNQPPSLRDLAKKHPHINWLAA